MRKILVFILLCWTVNITDATFEIYVYSNLQNSLAASGGVITFCTARLMVSPYVCREEHRLVPRQFSHVWPCLGGTFYMALALACRWYWWMGSPSTSNSLHHYHKLVAVSVLITFINSDGVRILYSSFQLSWFLLICN